MHRHIFFHPDCDVATSKPATTQTVGPGISPGLLTLLPGGERRSRARRRVFNTRRHTAGGEFHPALKTCAGPTTGRRRDLRQHQKPCESPARHGPL